VKKRPALLDVNVLIALFDETHIHHVAAHDWFADHRKNGWATCPLTENGFLRVLTHPRAGVEDDYATLLEHFRSFCAGRGHVFWNDSVSLRDERLFDPSVIVSHRQLTDVYLLGLASSMGGTLATFDARIPVRAVHGATTGTLTVIAPSE
jgi:toxin-antitoxin system PIN domain toxin